MSDLADMAQELECLEAEALAERHRRCGPLRINRENVDVASFMDFVLEQARTPKAPKRRPTIEKLLDAWRETSIPPAHESVIVIRNLAGKDAARCRELFGWSIQDMASAMWRRKLSVVKEIESAIINAIPLPTTELRQRITDGDDDEELFGDVDDSTGNEFDFSGAREVLRDL